ncbi:unnamed protein product [Merluccius merluccius]
MTDAEAMYENFIVSRRSGRRNAILPVEGKENQEGGSSVSATVMSHDLAQLHVNKSGEDPEKSQDPAANEAKEEDKSSDESSLCDRSRHF